MGGPVRPSIPADRELPQEIGAWSYDSEATWNGLTWSSEGDDREVIVFNHVNRIRVVVNDASVRGFESKETIIERKFEDFDAPVNSVDDPKVTWWGVEKAVDWMKRHAPEEWSHPLVDEAVYDAPPGFELEVYNVGNRNVEVYYRQKTDEDALEMIGGRRRDSEPSLDTRKYLYIQTWHGSGNSTIALAPWTRAHDHEMHEIVEPPEECGLAVAVKLAREWVAEQKDEPLPSEMIGQADLRAF